MCRFISLRRCDVDMESFLQLFLAACILSAAFANPYVRTSETEEEDAELDGFMAHEMESGGRSTRQGMGDTLTAGQSLTAGEKLTSKDGRFYLIYQADGNLAAYPSGGGKAFWDVRVKDTPGKALLQNDGTLVLLNAMNKKYWFSVSGITATAVPPYKLVMQNDRNIVIYDSQNKGVWFSRTTE